MRPGAAAAGPQRLVGERQARKARASGASNSSAAERQEVEPRARRCRCAPGRRAHRRSACACRARPAARPPSRRDTRPSSGSRSADGSRHRSPRARRRTASCASITSRPLFIIVAESTEILRPITQLGCAQASPASRASRSTGVRNGPPEAVSTRRRTPALLDSPARPHEALAEIALCSLSTGSSCAPPSAIAGMKQRAGAYDRLLVRQQHALAGARGGQCRHAAPQRRRSPPSRCRPSPSATAARSAVAPRAEPRAAAPRARSAARRRASSAGRRSPRRRGEARADVASSASTCRAP